MSTTTSDDARDRHYGTFYGLDPLPGRDGRPLVVVHGNCQAESLRVLLGAPDSPVRTVRIPPVHELTERDLPHLHRLLEQTDVVVSQPVRPGYRGLPIGTGDVMAGAGEGCRLVRVPVVRWAALHPFQVIVRSPEAGEPPVVPYHDLGTMALAVGAGPVPPLRPAAVRAVRDVSVRELAGRQTRHDTIDVVDLLLQAGLQACQVVNHPGNPVLRGAAQRVLEVLGYAREVPDPGRVLLDSIHAPVPAVVIEALGLDGEPTAGWRVHGQGITADEVREAQLDWYSRHPGVAQQGLQRHAEVAGLVLT